MRVLGYKQCNGDLALFFQCFKIGRVMILIVYVDDIIIIRKNNEKTPRFEKHLATCFEVKKLGILKYFIGIEIAQSINDFLMTQ